MHTEFYFAIKNIVFIGCLSLLLLFGLIIVIMIITDKIAGEFNKRFKSGDNSKKE